MAEEANVFIPDPDGFDELARSDEMTTALFIEAEGMADDIKALVPTNDDVITDQSNAGAPGEMRESIEVVPNADGENTSYDFGVRIAAFDWRFHWVEFGTGGRYNESGAFRGVMPAFGPFRRVAETADKFVPGGSADAGYVPGVEHGR